MGAGGATLKLVLGGLEFSLSSDNDKNFTIGGKYITEVQSTTGDPFFIVDKIPGALKGVEARLSHDDGSLVNFDSLAQRCAEGEAISALWKAPGGKDYTAKGGAKIVISGAEDGMLTTREGKLSFDIIPVKGAWIPA